MSSHPGQTTLWEAKADEEHPENRLQDAMNEMQVAINHGEFSPREEKLLRTAHALVMTVWTKMMTRGARR